MDSARERTSLTRVLFSMMLASVPMVAGTGAWAQQGGETLNPDAAEQDMSAEQAESGEPGGGDNGLPGDDAVSEEDKPWHEGVPLERRQAARAVFLEGNEFIKDTLFAKAADKYKQAIAIWGHPAFHYNLAIAQINLDQPIEAYRSLKEAMRYGEAPLGANRYEQTKNYLKLLESQLASLEVTCDEPGTEISVDGKPWFTGPGRRQDLVRPGEHQLLASKAGRVPNAEKIVLSPGQTESFTMTTVALSNVVEQHRWDAWKPWSVVGAGAVVILAGGIVHWRAAANFEEFDARFGELPCSADDTPVVDGCRAGQVTPALEDTLERARLQQRVAVATYIVGGAILTTGLAFVYLNRAQVMERSDAALSIHPFLSPSTMGIGARMQF